MPTRRGRSSTRRHLPRVVELHQRHVPGPVESSPSPGEPELSDLVETHRNIKFMMSVHSNGGQLFWQPGAYIANGRVATRGRRSGTRPSTGSRPTGSSRRCGAPGDGRHARERRRLVGRPVLLGRQRARGPVLQLRRSTRSAGRSAARSITRRPATSRAARSSRRGSASPASSPATSETMEYANGVMEMFRIAVDFGKDKAAATSTLVAGRAVGLAQGRALRGLRAGDGLLHDRRLRARRSQSPRYKQTEFREPGETLWVEATTTFRWFSVDAAGNLEPIRVRRRCRSARRGSAGGTVPATLSLAIGAPNASFGAFTPGVARDYTASTTANVISTAGDAALQSRPDHGQPGLERHVRVAADAAGGRSFSTAALAAPPVLQRPPA